MSPPEFRGDVAVGNLLHRVRHSLTYYTVKSFDLTPRPPSLRGKGEKTISPLLAGKGPGERLMSGFI